MVVLAAVMGILTSVPVLADGGSAVGNGGDIVSRFLESTRYTLRETFRRIVTVPKKQDALCALQAELSPDQKTECRKFLVDTARQVLELNQIQPVTQFLLRDEPLRVIGPDGEERQVDARTPLGREGNIEFHYPAVRNFSPVQLLALMTHEFGHKVLFEGRYVEDNVPTATFAMGRALLDAVAFALTSFAQEERLVGTYFRLFDAFRCTISIASGGTTGTQGGSPRLFEDHQNFDQFVTGIGVRPNDLQVWVIESAGSLLSFRAEIREAHGCHQGETEGRGVKIEIVRQRLGQQEEVVAAHQIDGWNPVCEESPRSLSLEFGSYRFECLFTGSYGRSDIRLE